jgi:DNA-directed RNA polymerase specialized sigma24 family protein
MSNIVIDYRALGLNPNWEDILIDLIDLDLALAESPRRRFIVGYILQGYTHKETAELVGIPEHQVHREIYRLRKKVNA